MEENTIFKTQQDVSRPANPDKQQPVSQITPTPLPSSPPAVPPGIKFPINLAFLLKGIIGIALIGGLLFGAITFVIPRFQQNKNDVVTLTYWGLWEGEQVMDTLIGDFERQYPNIKVQYKKEDVKDYRERLATRIHNGTGPDMFRYHNTWLPMFQDDISPIPTDVMATTDVEKIYYPVVKTDLVKNGALYGIPLEIDTLALFINSDMFKAAGAQVPTSWDVFLNTARLLTVKDEEGRIKTSGAAMGTFDNVTHAPDIISLLFVQNGADLFHLNNTSRNAVDAFVYYTSFAKDEGNVWDETLDPSILAFAKGNLAMYFGYSWDVFTIKAMNPNLAFEIHPVPHLPQRNYTIASYWVEGVSNKSIHQKEAMLFMKFLAQKESQQKLFTETSKERLFGEPYSRRDLADTLKNNQYIYPFVQQGKEAASSFFAADTYDNGLNSQMNTYLGNAIRSILAHASAESAVETLAQGIAQVLSRYERP